MKHRILIVIMAIVAALCLAFGVTACGDESDKSDNGNNTQQAVADCNAFKIAAILERIFADRSYAVGDFYAFKTAATLERPITNKLSIFIDNTTCYIVTLCSYKNDIGIVVIS